jgi:hypothetical protein
MTYKIEKLEGVAAGAPVFAVKYKKSWYTRWKYVRSKKNNEVLFYKTKRAAQAYINFQNNPRVKAQNS